MLPAAQGSRLTEPGSTHPGRRTPCQYSSPGGSFSSWASSFTGNADLASDHRAVCGKSSASTSAARSITIGGNLMSCIAQPRRSPRRFEALALLFVVPVLEPAAYAQIPDPAHQNRPSGAPRDVNTPHGSTTRHGLDPMEPAEIELAVAAVRKERRLGESVRFVSVSLNEPDKDAVRGSRPAAASPREAFMILLDRESAARLRGGRRPGHRRPEAIRGTPRGSPATDHARRVRRVRRGGPAVADLPRGDEEAGHRGPQSGHDRRLVGGPLRQ